MNIRRVLLDVDKALARPTLIDLAAVIDAVEGVEAINITVTEIDMETMDMDVIIEGRNLDYDALVAAIESAGAVVHSLDEIAIGERMVTRVERPR